MCLIVVAYQAHSQYPLIFGGNRDEFLARPTARAEFWNDAPEILAGRDLFAGGTWFGVTRTGRFAAVTNFRDPSQRHPHPKSRGLLVSEFLRSSESMRDFATRIDVERNNFDGFNLLFGDRQSIWYVSNRTTELASPLPPGVHALSNHLLNTPWPKVERVKRAMTDLLHQQSENALESGVFSALADEHAVPDEQLPSTGVSLQWERALATAFIRTEGYGTRSSTMLTYTNDGDARFIERGFDESSANRSFHFRIEPYPGTRN